MTEASANSLPVMLTEEELGAAWRLGGQYKRTLREWERRRGLPVIKVGGVKRYPSNLVLEWAVKFLRPGRAVDLRRPLQAEQLGETAWMRIEGLIAAEVRRAEARRGSGNIGDEVELVPTDGNKHQPGKEPTEHECEIDEAA